MLAVPAVLAAVVLSLPLAAAVALVIAAALAADEVGVASIAPTDLPVGVVLIVGVVLVVVCCTLVTRAKICAELVLLVSLLVVEFELLEDAFPVFPFEPVLELVLPLELVPEVELLDDDVDEVEEVDELDEPELFDWLLLPPTPLALLPLLLLPLLTSRLSTSPKDSPDEFSVGATLLAAAAPAPRPFMLMIGAVLMLFTVSQICPCNVDATPAWPLLH